MCVQVTLRNRATASRNLLHVDVLDQNNDDDNNNNNNNNKQ